MPMKPIQVKANFQLDTSAARAQLQGLQRELSSITKGATMDLGITSQITQAIREAQQLKQVLAEATDFSTGAFDLSKFDAAIKQQGKTIAEFKQSLQTLGPEGEKAFNSLATTIASAQVPLKRTSQGIQQMMTAFGNTMRWQATSMAMHKIVGTIQQAYSYAQNLDKSLNKIQIVTGHNVDYMRNFAREANKAAQALSASTLEYTNASLIYYQQGLSDKEVTKRAETTLKLAKVTGESASKVSQQMTAVWNNFSNGVDNLERYADVMTALGATTASSSSEIAKGLEKFASVTKTIGLSYDYAASALATVTAQTRQSADSVGTAFKTLFSRLESLNLGETLDDSVTLNKYSEALLKVGVNVMDASGKLKNMDNILDELGGKWNNLNKAQQVALAQTVGGVRNYTSLITLMDNWDKFQTNLVTSQLAEGTLQHQADIYAQSWEAAQQRVKTASQGIYDTLISSDFFKGFNNAFAGVLNTINKAGQTLGSVGSTAGIMNLFLAANKDSVAKGIDNFTVNTLGQTSFGQNIFRAQQQAILKDLTSEIYDTGIRSSQIRKDVYQELTNQWDNFRNKTYSSKADYQTNQMMMQQLTTQAQNVMNNAIDMDNLKLQSSMAQRSAAELFAGKFKMGGGMTETVATRLGSLFDNQSAQGGYKAGFTEYLQDTFVKNLTKLSGMDLSNASNQAVKALSGQIQAQAQNALKNEALKTVIEGEGKGSPLSTAFNLMSAGNLSKNDITTILENLSSFNTSQIQSYEQLRAKLDQDFLKNNPDAVQKETVRTRVGNRMVSKTQVVRDANGNLVMDENSAAAKEYLARMSDQKEAAIAARKAGYITEQQLEDIKSGNKNLKDILKPQEEMTTSFGQAAVSAGMMVNSMAMAVSSLNNFKEQIQNGTVTATGTMSMLGSLGMAAGQMVPVLTNTTKILGTGLSVAGLGGIAALATLGIGATVYGVNVAKAQGINAKTDYANESKIASIAQAKEDQQKYDQFLPVMQQQQQALDKLTSLQAGTPEYTAQLIASNNAAREIIDTYGLKAGINYNIGENGAINFTAAQIKQTNDDLLKQLQESDFFSQAAISGFDQLSGIKERLRLSEKIADLALGPDVDVNRVVSQAQLEAAWAKAQEDNVRGAATFSSAEAWSIGGTREDAIKQLAAAGYLTDVDIEINDEQLQQLREEYDAQMEQSNLAAQADFQSILNSALSTTNKTEELQLAAKALGLDSEALENYQKFLKEDVYSSSGFLGLGDASATRDSTGGLRSAGTLRKLYEAEFGHQASADILNDQQALASAIENHRIQTYLLDQLKDVGDQFKGTSILSDFLNINDRSYSSMREILNKTVTENMSEEVKKVYDSFVSKALTDSVKAQDNLVQAMMNNQQFQGMQFLEIAKQLQEVEEGANLSTTQLETATNYLNSFTNNFGDTAGKAVFDALTNNRTGWNQDYYEALQKISLDNSISALADLTHFTNLGVNADLAEPLGNLRKAILADIDDRGGLAKTLFTSSEFTKVFDSLTEQYKATGEITAQNIADLAKKNEIIGDYMTVTGSNEQTIADMMEMISSGNISVEGITPAIEHFVQRASGAEGAQQEALDVVAEQDLSDSITNMDKWAQNIGKAWYVGRTHDVLGDRPVLEGLKMVLTPQDYADYIRTLAIGAYGGTTSSMLSSMKGNMANAYAMLSELEGTGKKRGKGGGGMDTIYEYLAKEGIFDESGIQFDTNTNNFVIGGDKFAAKYGQGDENKLITFSGLKDYIIESLVGSTSDGEGGLTGYRFKGQGYSREQAEDLAAMMLGSMSASSMGTILSASGLIDAANTFFGELKGEGQQQGNYITPEQYDALFNQYSDVLATMKMERENNEWKLHEASIEEMQTEGFKGVTALEWREYFIQEAKKAGSAIIGIKGTTQIGKQDAVTIGKAIADASQGTIKKGKENEETAAIVQAAVAAGVQMYNDYNMAASASSYIYADRNKVGQSLDYDQLQNFYNNVLGLSTDILNSHLEKISEQNGDLAFTHKWTDAYGVEHNVNSRDYANTSAFTRAIEQEQNFSETILNFQRDQWVADFFTGKHDETFYNQYGGKNATGAMRYLDEMFTKAQQEAQSAATATTQSNPVEGGETTPQEGGEETPPEGEGTANVTGTTGVVTTPEGAYNAVGAEAQKAVGEYKNYTYRGGPESADVYRYNLLHPTLTPAQAYDAVKYGNVDVDAEWNKKYPSTTPTGKEGSAYWTNQPQGAGTGTTYTVDKERAHQRALEKAAAKEGSAYWTSQPPEGRVETTYTVNREAGHQSALEKAAAKEGSAYWTSQPPEGRVGTIYTVDREGAHQSVLVKAAERAAAKEGSAYWTSQPLEGRVGTIYTVDREGAHQQAVENEIARRAEENAAERAAAKEGSAYWTANATEIHGPENAELIHWQQQQQLEKEAREAAEKIAAEQATAEAKAAEEAAYLAGLSGQQLETAYLNGEITEEQFQNEAYRRAMAPTVQPITSIEGVSGEKASSKVTTKEEESIKEPTTKEMRDFLKENGYTNASINTAMREEGMSLKDLYQQVNNSLKENNKYARITAEGIGEVADNTGEMAETREEAKEKETTDKAIGKDTGKKDTDKDKDIFGNTGNTTIINEGGGDSGSGDEGWWPGKPGGTTAGPKLDFKLPNFGLPTGGLGTKAQLGGGGGNRKVGSGKPIDRGGTSVRAGISNDGGGKIEIKLSASGQNNARLLGYAKGKEGHIAVTGELGPELRVKTDGSMDLLGKTGREYTWVDPSDKIYTASQTASIIGSNNSIPQLDALSKGINNFIPGYFTAGESRSTSINTDKGGSGSGGGGGSSGSRSRGGGEAAEKDPRYDPNTLKIRDILERYYTILQKIDDITRAVEKFAKVADRAWGQDRIKAIEKQTALYQQQYDAQKQYVQQINEYMGTDKNALTTMVREFVDSYNEGKEDKDKLTWTGAQFDSNGVLTNYREFVEKLVEQYNANAEANSSNQEAQYKFQEQLKDIQMYTDTLNLWESETDKLQELANQILDNSLKEITYRVEYELELNADQKRLLDFQDSFIKDDIFRVADHIANMNKEIANTADSLEKTRQGLYDYLGTLAGENMRVGETYDDVALGLATRDEKGVVNTKSYEDIDFKEVSNNLDKWLTELREKDTEGAKEVDKILQRNEEGIITNYRDVLNKINALNEQLSHNSINLLLSDAQAFFDQISNLTNNPKWTGLSTEMKDQITNYMDQFIQYIQSMGEEFKEIVESMGDSLKAFGKKIDSEIDEFDYYGDVYKSFGNIIDLTNQHMTDITSDFFKVLNSKALDNNINKIEATRRRYDLFTNTLAQVQQQYNAMVDRMNAAQGVEEKAFYQQRVDELKEQLDIANSQMESAHKDFLQSWEDALSKIQENYKDAIEQASKEFEKGFSPLFNTLALLQAQFDREKALGDLYVDNYQKIHDLNKLDRDITASINDTDNLRGKQRLRDLQEEINQLQEDGTELSEYDLDILDKKYKLELARQALEDAKDAKSMVRLARDNNGNWSYVYTANQDEVDKAEQDYEDAIRDMEQANEDYIKNIQDQILNVQQEAQQAILALQPEDFATYDDYLAAIQNIQNSMYQTLDYLRSQMNNAFGNNTWLENYVPNIVQDHGLTDNFDDTTLAGLLVNGDLDQVINNARENFENNLIAPALEAFTKYSEKQQEVYDKAQYNMATIGEEFGTEMDTLTQKSEDQVNVVLNLADRIGTEFDGAMDQIIQATNDWLDKIKDVVSEYDILLKQITDLKRIDGEYVEPAKLINGDNAVDTWAEVDRFKNELLDNGTMYLITTDPTTGKEKATKFVAGTKETKDFLYDAKVAAAKQEGEMIDIGDDGVDENEYKKVNNYLDTHDEIVWIKYKDSEGEHEKLFTSKAEWEEWYKQHIKVVHDDGGDYHPPDNGWTYSGGNYHFAVDTGGYTGRWQSADTGMYTGEWPSGSVRRNGRLAWLHQKELVLNAHDTENFLDAMEIVRQLDNLTNWMANGLGDLTMPKVTTESGELEQNVHIEAEFPNVTDHNEIEQAFNNLVNMASQYANRK